MSALLLGLDLAWSPRNPSGAVALHPVEGEGIGGPSTVSYAAAEPLTLRSDEEILGWTAQQAAGAELIVLAIDAPLLAPNPAGTSRAADKATTSLYGWAHAGTYPANAVRCARPVALAAALERGGWSLSPFALREEVLAARREPRAPAGRFVIEVYPHAACVGLFGLPRIISYKKGHLAKRRLGLESLQDLLHGLLPRLDPDVVPSIRPFARQDVGALRGRGLKALEDRLDALLCAAMAAAFVHAPERCEIAGARTPAEARHGYIVVPKPPAREATPRSRRQDPPTARVRLIPIDARLLAGLETAAGSRGDGFAAASSAFRKEHDATLASRLDAHLAHAAARQSLEHSARTGTMSPWIGYLAACAATGRVVGLCGFKGKPNPGVPAQLDEPSAVVRAAEIAYQTFAAHERRGYATAMARALVTIACRHGLPAVIAHTLPEENASTRALRRNAFVLQGELHDPEDGRIWRWMRPFGADLVADMTALQRADN
ncbi:MAG: GNAT family N-acetyltransferase [Planctomycetota bacterium]